jgi:hypothetical protein
MRTAAAAAPMTPSRLFPWEPDSARRGKIATEALRGMLMRRLKGTHGVHPQTLMSAAGVLTGFAAQNAALEQGEILSLRRDLVAPQSLLMHRTSKGERFLFGSWVNAPLLAGYGHGAPLQRFLIQAAESVGLAKSALPDFKAIEARVSARVGTPAFGWIDAPAGHRPAAKPQDLLKALWPQTRRILTAPMPMEFTDEPPLHEAHWPVIISVVAGALATLSLQKVDPVIALTLAMESAVIGARLDPELIDPNRWTLSPGPKGLKVARADAHKRVA